MKLKQKIIALVLLLLCISTNLSVSEGQPQSKQEKAAAYLTDHFNETIDLIYESEDTGTMSIKGYQYSHNQIYFIYSDNLLAKWALKPYDAQISNKINQKLLSYNLPTSDFYEVLFGTKISPILRAGDQLSIEPPSTDYVVLAEFHNSSIVLNPELNGDTLIYQSLNCYLNGNKTAADQYFYKAYEMWDGKGIYDASVNPQNPPEDYVPHYSNYKLALVLYASRVLNITINDYNEIESKLWSMQQGNGGITSWADLNGNLNGSANTETTSIALLPYNEALIQAMQSAAQPTLTPTSTLTPVPSIPEFPLIILAVLLPVGLCFGLLIGKKKATKPAV